MEKFITALLGVAFVMVLIFGKSHWNQQLAASAKHTPTNQASTAQINQQNADGEANEKELLKLTRNWPETAIASFKQTLDEKRAFKILFAGSPAIGSETAGTYPLVKQKLVETFGQDHIQVDINTYDSTSKQFLANHNQEEIAASKADLIVLEPFILLNNGKVVMKDTLTQLTSIIEDIKASQPETTIILQPSYPLYKAKIYPSQVIELKQYAEKHQLPYLDHWTAWPDSNSVVLNDYLLPDQSAPSDKGNQVWSNYLLQYFISESESK